MRTNGRWLLVALSDGYSMIVEEVLDEEGGQILANIREGDRFHTPITILDEASSTRVIVGANGTRVRG